MADRREWDRRHESARTPAAPSRFVAEWATSVASLRPAGRALDLACGSGRHTRLLVDLGFRTVATDFSRAALARAAPTGGRARPVLGDAMHLPFADGAFDLVVQTNFLERSLFPALARLLRPGGFLLAETFSLTQHQRTGHPRRAYCLLPGEIEQLCTAPGTELDVVATVSGDYGDGEHPLHLTSIAARRP